MSITPVVLILPQQLTNAAATYYTSTGIRTRIDKFSLTNTDVTAHTVTIYLVPSGGVAGNPTMITKTRALAGNETWNCPDMVGQMMPAGGTIQALADANASVTISAAGTLIS